MGAFVNANGGHLSSNVLYLWCWVGHFHRLVNVNKSKSRVNKNPVLLKYSQYKAIVWTHYGSHAVLFLVLGGPLC